MFYGEVPQPAGADLQETHVRQVDNDQNRTQTLTPINMQHLIEVSFVLYLYSETILLGL